MTENTFWGPLNYVVFTFPQHADVTAALGELEELVASDQIRVLDLAVIGRNDDGEVVRLKTSRLSQGQNFDFERYDGSASFILSDHDLAEVAVHLGEDTVAGVIVYEARLMAGIANEIADQDGSLAFTGTIDAEGLYGSLKNGADWAALNAPVDEELAEEISAIVDQRHARARGEA